MNELLRNGAAPVLSVDDVLEAIGIHVRKQRRRELEGAAGSVLAALRDAPATADELSRALGHPVENVAALLTELELDGLVEMGDGAYRATVAA